MAMAFIQWVSRTHNGWMTRPAGSAGVSARSWIASIDMAFAMTRSIADCATLIVHVPVPRLLNYVNKVAPDAPTRMLRRTNPWW
jgi:hypothetical protein